MASSLDEAMYRALREESQRHRRAASSPDEARSRALREESQRQQREARLERRVELYLARLWRQALAALARRPGVSSALVWLTIGALVWLDAVRPVVTVPHEAAWISFVVQGIVSAFAYIAAEAVTYIVTIAQVLWMIGKAIVDFAVAVAMIVKKVYELLAGFWTSTLKPAIDWAWRAFDRFVLWLDKTLGPILKFLNDVRAQVQKFYDKWFKPIFDTIDATRRILQLLARLHVPWAQALDNHLAYLESKLLAPIQLVMYKINEALNWINRIITFDGFLQRVTLIRSLMRYQADSLKIWWTSIHKPLGGADRDVYERPPERRSVDAVRADYVAYVRDGSGPDRARIDEHAADLRLRLARIGRLHPA